MVASTQSLDPNSCPDSVQAGFLALLPRIRLHAQIFFRHLKCAHKKEDAVAEAVALTWLWYVRLTRRGKDASQFVTVLAAFAARAAHSGRRLCGQEKAKDVLSPTAQRRHGFAVGRLPDVSTLESNPWDEALIDNTQSPVPDQVTFRCDFPDWRGIRTDRDRRLIDDLMCGERTRLVRRHADNCPRAFRNVLRRNQHREKQLRFRWSLADRRTREKAGAVRPPDMRPRGHVVATRGRIETPYRGRTSDTRGQLGQAATPMNPSVAAASLMPATAAPAS